MPFAVFSKVREVSSEDEVHSAQNLIHSQVGKKWKTKSSGEKIAYVILELSNSQKICGIDIGNEHSAFIGVLVGKANSPPDDFKEILLTSSFMTPMESRNSTNINRVRCFNYEALVSPVADSKWSLIKVICTQPFNKHVPYGLSFIKVHVVQEVDGRETINIKRANAVRQDNHNCIQKIGKFKFREPSPDSGNESTSQLFKRWKELKVHTSPELQKETKIGNSDISKKIHDTSSSAKDAGATKTVQNCNKFVNKVGENGNKTKLNESPVSKQERKSTELPKMKGRINTSQIQEKKQREYRMDSPREKSKTDNKIRNGNVNVKCKPLNRLLEHVTFVISGIENPGRTDLRNKAQALGAKYKANWDNTCTHLICAFKNTPKYNEVKGKGRIVKRNWIEKCYDEKKYLPWRRFALDNTDSQIDESDEEIHNLSHCSTEANDCSPVTTNNSSSVNYSMDDSLPSTSRSFSTNTKSESDTDDEIDRIQKRRKISSQQNTLIETCDIYEANTEEEDYLIHKSKQINLL